MKFYILIIMLCFSGLSYSWDGIDDDGNSVEIGSGELVRAGNDIDIEIDGETKTVEVESVSSDEVEVYDYDSGEYKTFDMD